MSRRRYACPGLATLFGALLALIVAMLLPARAYAQAGAALTNDDVIKMVQNKLPDVVVVAKIKSSICKFDTSTDTLIKLKQVGLSDAVLQAMAEASAPAKEGNPSGVTPAGPSPDPNDPLAEHDPGIYYVRQNPGGRQMTELEPTAYSGGKTGGVFASAMTYGIHKAKWKAIVQGGQAKIRITEETPTFYFYFEQKHGTLSYSGGAVAYFQGLSSPSQFSLIRFDAKKDSRELAVFQVGLGRASTGTPDKDVVDFDFQKAAPGIYKVTPRGNLKPGEYCFFYAGQGTMMGMGGGSLFDFGINPPE